jgi:hypothetical protein
MALKEKGQYALAFGVVAVMLFAVGFPVFLLGFFGVLAFFVWRLITAESRSDTRKIFEFYLSASEILRHDERRWYGFEIKETIARGEAIVQAMKSAPPLINFTLGALYHKLGDNGFANKYLSLVADSDAADEASIVFPTKELRDYVRVLRKIERSPAEAPLTSAAVRSLERARKNRAKLLLEEVRAALASEARAPQALPAGTVDDTAARETQPNAESVAALYSDEEVPETPAKQERQPPRSSERAASRRSRQTISEVLHDIYDGNA